MALGRQLLNLHTYGERLLDLGRGVNPGLARLTVQIGPEMPDEFVYDPDEKQLRVGKGVVAPVERPCGSTRSRVPQQMGI